MYDTNIFVKKISATMQVFTKLHLLALYTVVWQQN